MCHKNDLNLLSVLFRYTEIYKIISYFNWASYVVSTSCYGNSFEWASKYEW